jgi:hypothetical protein
VDHRRGFNAGAAEEDVEMSLKTWKKEFYPVDAGRRMSRATALRHSLRKWRGLQRKNLKRHRGKSIWNYDLGFVDGNFEISWRSCALCTLYYNEGCRECPLSEVREGVNCDATLVEESRSPYRSFNVDGDPHPMIRLIRKAMKKFNVEEK